MEKQIKVSQFQYFLFQLPKIMQSYKLLLYQNFIQKYDFDFILNILL